jgi:hypothetical protein
VNVLECADPGGSAAGLPKNDSTCDGLTIQGNTVLVKPDGSVAVAGYTIYRLPSPTLGEQANAGPVCNDTNACVLYVGQNQNAFSQPKMFSPPFTVVGGPAGRPASTAGSGASVSLGQGSAASSSSAVAGSADAPGTSTGSAPAAGTAGVSPSTSAEAGSLALTGVPPLLPWMAGVGGLFLLTGAVGRRRVGASTK